MIILEAFDDNDNPMLCSMFNFDEWFSICVSYVRFVYVVDLDIE